MFIGVEVLRSVYLRRDTAQCLFRNRLTLSAAVTIMVASYMLNRGYFDISSPDLIRLVGVRLLGSCRVCVKVS